MKAARFLPPLLAGATVILLAANALPAVRRKHRLQEQKRSLIRELEYQQERDRRLRAEVEALKGDPFFIQRVLAETWNGVPEGAIAFRPEKTTD